jgi:exosortase E/protease (VPEID-CTERM system)
VRNLAWLAALGLAETLAVTVWLDTASLAGAAGVARWIGDWGPWILRAAIGFLAAFAAFAALQGGRRLGATLEELSAAPVRPAYLAVHFLAMAAFLGLSARVFQPDAPPHPLAAAGWLLAGSAAAVAAVAAFLPPRFLAAVRRQTGAAWFYAAAVSLLAVSLARLSQSIWQSTARLTFHLVGFLLRPVFPELILQPERLRVRAPNFGVVIDQACSGLEGAGLMLVFTAVWLLLFRRELRFPRALLLVPAGVLTTYLLNAARIAALVIIGNAGAPQIAIGGFHSQAGWIAFNGVALAMALLVPRIGWFYRTPASPPTVTPANNPTAAYLLPFLAILASGMLARALSADFEWFYGLRFIAAATALYAVRSSLRTLDWRTGLWGPLGGAAVFAMWLGLDWLQGTPASAAPAALLQADARFRTGWILIRVAAATITVPLAEELAFRGFLMRRWASASFENVPFRATPWSGIVVSSVAFGLLHGNRVLAGILAALVFACLARHTNRLGDAVVAHAVANALLAAAVLGWGQWQLW